MLPCPESLLSAWLREVPGLIPNTRWQAGRVCLSFSVTRAARSSRNRRMGRVEAEVRRIHLQSSPHDDEVVCGDSIRSEEKMSPRTNFSRAVRPGSTRISVRSAETRVGADTRSEYQ